MLQKTAIVVARYLGIAPALRLFFKKDSALRRLGWMVSVKRGYPVDAHGEALPWLTYPAIRFLTDRLSEKMTVYEYGAGFSTIWFSKRVKQIYSVEHDREWIDHLSKWALPNSIVTHRTGPQDHDYNRASFADAPDNCEYVKSIRPYISQCDVVLIDGIWRNACAMEVCKIIKSSAVIIYDNTEFPGSLKGVKLLEGEGYKKIDFEGMVPTTQLLSTTSFFYKNGNCFSL